MSNILTIEEFREIFYQNNTCHLYKDFKELYEELNILNATQLKDLIRAFNGASNVYKEVISKNIQQFNDKFKADTKNLIQAHNTNMLFLHFSPLLERLYFHYVYIHYFREQNKELQKLKDEIELLFKERYIKNKSSYKYTDKRIIRFEKLIGLKKSKNLCDLTLKEKKKSKIKQLIESDYEKKYHQDDHYKWLVYELVGRGILTVPKANKIIKSIFGYNGYIQYDDNLKTQFECNTLAFILAKNY